MRRLPLLVCIPFCLVLTTPLPGQVEEPAAAEAGTGYGAPTAAPGSSDPATGGTTGLPRAAPPPRTLRSHWHVFVAFAIAWGLLFGYALALGRRFGTIERRIERLERDGG